MNKIILNTIFLFLGSAGIAKRDPENVKFPVPVPQNQQNQNAIQLDAGNTVLLPNRQAAINFLCQLRIDWRRAGEPYLPEHLFFGFLRTRSYRFVGPWEVFKELSPGIQSFFIEVTDVTLNQVEDLENLNSCEFVKKLKISKNNKALSKEQAVEFLRPFPQLRELYMHDSGCQGGSQASVLLEAASECCPFIKIFDWYTRSSIDNLFIFPNVEMSELRTLNLCLLSDQGSLSGWTSLAGLHHANFPKLQTLTLAASRNPQDLSFLEGMLNLQYLSLYANQDVQPMNFGNVLSTLPALQTFKTNGVVDVLSGVPLATIKELFLAAYSLTPANRALIKTQMPSLRKLYVADLPMDAQSLHERKTLLYGNDVTITKSMEDFAEDFLGQFKALGGNRQVDLEDDSELLFSACHQQ